MVRHYPLLFAPIYKEMLWGGSRLGTKYNRQLPYDKTGESWDISCRPGEMSLIENGPNLGMTLEDYIARDRVGALGTRLAATEHFPLLVKLIDANDVLSVQVHPDDYYAAKGDGIAETATNGVNLSAKEWQPTDTGKNEMWYILAPPTDGHLIIGLKPGITPQALRKAYEDNTIEDCLNRLPVKTGDIVNIPAGLIHALTPGVMVAEVQQNSDITYRLYDYNRVGLDGKPRQLHVDDAIAVADFEGKIPRGTVPGLTIKKGDCTMVYSIANPYFAIIKYELGGVLEETSDPAAFCVFTCVEGEGEVLMPSSVAASALPTAETAIGNANTDVNVELSTGRSVFIPAGLGRYTLRPKQGKTWVLLKSFVPDIEKDFVAPLLSYGYNSNDIALKTAVSI